MFADIRIWTHSMLEASNLDPNWYAQNGKDVLQAGSYGGLGGLLQDTARLSNALIAASGAKTASGSLGPCGL
jgi:hypothetical protein